MTRIKNFQLHKKLFGLTVLGTALVLSGCSEMDALLGISNPQVEALYEHLESQEKKIQEQSKQIKQQQSEIDKRNQEEARKEKLTKNYNSWEAAYKRNLNNIEQATSDGFVHSGNTEAFMNSMRNFITDTVSLRYTNSTAVNKINSFLNDIKEYKNFGPNTYAYKIFENASYIHYSYANRSSGVWLENQRFDSSNMNVYIRELMANIDVMKRKVYERITTLTSYDQFGKDNFWKYIEEFYRDYKLYVSYAIEFNPTLFQRDSSAQNQAANLQMWTNLVLMAPFYYERYINTYSSNKLGAGGLRPYNVFGSYYRSYVLPYMNDKWESLATKY